MLLSSGLTWLLLFPPSHPYSSQQEGRRARPETGESHSAGVLVASPSCTGSWGKQTEIQGSAGKKCEYWGLPSLYCVSVTVSHSVFSMLVSSGSLLFKSLGEDLVPVTSEQPSELLGIPDTCLVRSAGHADGHTSKE